MSTWPTASDRDDGQPGPEPTQNERVAQLTQERDEARAEIERLRPVVEEALDTLDGSDLLKCAIARGILRAALAADPPHEHRIPLAGLPRRKASAESVGRKGRA